MAYPASLHSHFNLIFSACGGTIDENELDYPGKGSYYPSNKLCKWTIKRNYTYVIEFLRFDVEDSRECKYNYLQVDGRGKLCGTNTPPAILIDKHRGRVDVTFSSYFWGTGKGFHMKIVKDPGKSS